MAWILETKVNQLEQSIKKFNKKAEKYNQPALSYTIDGERFVRFVINHKDDTKYPVVVSGLLDDAPTNCEFISTTLRQVNITVTGELPKINGYTFVGTIDHKSIPGANLIKSYIKVDERFLTSKPVCEHCNSSRQRNETFIIEDESDKQVQVGRSCLQEYLRDTNATKIASLLEEQVQLLSNEDDCDWDDVYGEVQPVYVPLVEFLAFVVADVNKSGYVSKAKAEETGNMTSSDYALKQLFAVSSERDVQITQEHIQQAKTIIEFFKENKKEFFASEFMYNLYVIANGSGCIGVRAVGFAAAMVPTYNRMNNVVANSEDTSEFIGEVGQRMEFTGKIATVFGFDTQFGYQFITIIDCDGNKVKYQGKHIGEVGTIVKFMGTVKEHAEYKGTKQTVVNRPKFMEV